MKDIQKITISIKKSIKDALEIFGSHDGLRLLVVNDEQENFIGIITDPDIRRGLLRGLRLEDDISSIINRSPIVAHINTPREELLHLASQHNIHEIPLKNDEGKIVEIVSVANLIKPTLYPNQVVIMAGGLGTRLRPLTDTLPKPMLKVGSKPILQIILERFKQQGFRNIFLCVNYKSHIIEKYFGDGSKFGLHITYIREEKRMGTAGALSLISNLNDDFIVMNGDILTDIDFTKMLHFHKQNESDATMGIREYSTQIPYGVVNTNGTKIISIEEKPSLSFNVSAGIYTLNPKVLQLIPKDEFFDMPALFETILAKNDYNTFSYLIEDYWIDIGRKEEYDRANSEIEED
ncbi:nucleotidyltransferase family protein [Helicobacter brantae]|uniref:Alcohol dehydrogenase n=1 Tax=Helicobacter brantae TaxID=375927 RepID=A0A3D8J5S1_9HELI|nr:nucleotidyltransferase family protein [Helicobacter brantae]RDU72141.1 alcohol dehydrogenase [Helicobacter brantae]